MQAQLSVLSSSELERIQSAVHRVLAEKGVRFNIPACSDVFRGAGFQVNAEGVVRIAADQLDAALATVPRRFIRRGASPDRDVAIGDGETKFAVGSLPIWIIENGRQLERRAATLDDLHRFTRLSESLAGFEIGNPVVQPQELPVDVMHLLWNRTVSIDMTKPACCWYVTSPRTGREGLEVLRLAAGGIEELRQSRRWALTVCPDSALVWGKSAIGVLTHAPAEIPVEILPMPFLGSMYPVTMAGALVQSAAETLALAVLTQLVHPGCPVLFAPSYGGVMDMKVAAHSFGAPESALFAAASSQLGHAFGLPTDMMQGTSDSKLPDAQAAWEKTLALLLPALAGADCVTQAGGLLDDALSASYEQLCIDNEIVGNVKRILRPEAIDAETLALEEIMALPFGGHYLQSEHTLRHFRRSLFVPDLAERRSWQQWVAEGMKDAARRAAERVDALLLADMPSVGIPAERRGAVDRFIAETCREYSVDAARILPEAPVSSPSR